MADGYDFRIDTLKFRAAISDQYPYSRGTAPFRKEQVDQSATVGDQSLTGWWTRGQLSFHKGQGIKFYEILDGEGVLNRFADASHINPWEPGRVELAADGRESYTWALAQDLPDPTVYSIQQAIHTSAGLYVVAGTTGSPYGKVVLCPGLDASSNVEVTTTQPFSAPEWLLNIGDSDETILMSIGEHIDVMSAGATAGIQLWQIDDVVGGAGTKIRKMFYAKERVWAVNSDGRWYTLDLAGGTVPSGGGSYVFWDAPRPAVGLADYAFTFAESAGAVFFARGQYIWATTVSESGNIATPYVVADLGPGAEITGLACNRGRLGILTRTNFRVAEILGEDGSLVVGPAYLQFGNSSSRGMATYGDFLYFAAKHPDDVPSTSPTYNDYSIFEVKMGDDVSELEPAWVVHDRALLDGSNGGIAVIIPAQYVASQLAYVAWQTPMNTAYGGINVNAWYNMRYDDGYLVTAQHRLGTLELKQFFSITLTVEASPGDSSQLILVCAVDKDGNETTVGIARNGQNTFDLTGFDPAESMGFKFVFYRGLSFSNYSPALLGYQIKALPVPQRQRILKWPLSIQDLNRLRRGTAAGRAGKAYEDLAALEALESSQAIVTFNDLRLGESGQAYIDSVEFQSDTPPTATTDGFGGVAYVTLRVLE